MPRRWQVWPEGPDDDGWREATYYAVVESYRDAKGKPQRRTVAPLGTDLTPGDRAAALRLEADEAHERGRQSDSRAEAYAGRAAELAAEAERAGANAGLGIEFRIERERGWSTGAREVAGRWRTIAARLEAEAEWFEDLQRQVDDGPAMARARRAAPRGAS